MATGTVKKIMDKGFGFIATEGQAKDLFFHSSEVKNVSFADLQEGDTVTFDILEGDAKGPKAVNVNKA